MYLLKAACELHCKPFKTLMPALVCVFLDARQNATALILSEHCYFNYDDYELKSRNPIYFKTIFFTFHRDKPVSDS
jgi:hypothetical protein